MNHQIIIESEVEGLPIDQLSSHITRCITGALEQEGICVPCEVSVLLTDNQGIRQINREYRDVDRETDVLSFPMFEFVPGDFPDDVSNLLDPGSALLPLGDMALSVEKIRSQAQEFGHSEDREIGYLTVHSVLHLLGYDHLDEGEMKKQMRAREDAIMEFLNIPRN